MTPEDSQKMDKIYPMIKYRMSWLIALVVWDIAMLILMLMYWNAAARFWCAFAAVVLGGIAGTFLKRSIDKTVKKEWDAQKPEG